MNRIPIVPSPSIGNYGVIIEPQPPTVKDVIALLNDVVANDVPLTDGLKRGIWTWIGINPGINAISLYREIVKHPKIRRLELGWPPVSEHPDAADDETADEHHQVKEARPEFTELPGGMFS